VEGFKDCDQSQLRKGKRGRIFT